MVKTNNMKKYFYSNDEEKHGPFSFDELKNEDIKNDTLIWFEGLDDWTNAKYILELKEILELSPPPIPFNKTDENLLNNDSIEVTEGLEISSPIIDSCKSIRQEMFSKVFSYDGRIRRMEFGFSLIIYLILYLLVTVISESGKFPIIGLAMIPLIWFLSAQGAKRCHDMGQSGWYQIIPFYYIWMIFANGKRGINEYGMNPKG